MPLHWPDHHPIHHLTLLAQHPSFHWCWIAPSLLNVAQWDTQPWVQWQPINLPSFAITHHLLCLQNHNAPTTPTLDSAFTQLGPQGINSSFITNQVLHDVSFVGLDIRFLPAEVLHKCYGLQGPWTFSWPIWTLIHSTSWSVAFQQNVPVFFPAEPMFKHFFSCMLHSD